MNKSPLLIASDLDGTLLTDDKKIRLETRLFFRKLEKRGNIIVLATGRPVRTTIPFYKKLKIHNPIICYNGAYCFDPLDENFKVIDYPIEKDVVKNNYLYIKEHFADAALCENLHHIYYDGEKELFGFTLIRDKNDPKFLPTEIKGSFEKTIDENVYSFILHALRTDEEFVQEIKEYVKAKMPGYIVDFWNENWYFEIRKEGINKASTLKILQEKFNVSSENIFTFGDSTNDVELVHEFKNGYRMKNSRQCLKKENVTIKDNNHNGVVSTLKLILKSRD